MTTVPRTVTTPDPMVPTWHLGELPWRGATAGRGRARARAIVDNDFSGDPDDLFHLVHQLLSTSVEVRAVIGSHLRAGDPFDPGPHSAQNAVTVARDVFSRMGLADTDLIIQGSDLPLADPVTPRSSAAADAIIAEALRDDERPLYYLAGGGLTDLASAYLIEPRIASRIRLIWIGGNEHPGLAPAPPDAMPVEYNLLIDVTAAQVVFNDSTIGIWQVPRDVYRQCLVSDAELRHRVAATGPLGEYLYRELETVTARTVIEGRGPGETYALGDSPLALLTALQSLFEADPSSSSYVAKPVPRLEDDGRYSEVDTDRQMRVYTHVDVRLMFEDFYLKLREFADWQAAASEDLPSRV